MTGSAKTHKGQRKLMRRRLRARGVPETEIERIVDAKRAEQQSARDTDPPTPPAVPSRRAAARRAQALQAAARRAGVPVHDLEAHWDRQHAALRPDDRGYKPDPIDPLERGAARVNTRTANAARRLNATTRYELNRAERVYDQETMR